MLILYSFQHMYRKRYLLHFMFSFVCSSAGCQRFLDLCFGKSWVWKGEFVIALINLTNLLLLIYINGHLQAIFVLF